ncbi:c-type cytochrome biogenesis protein CcmI [Parasaccharibacter sp. TMW2.1882]|uniref:c-type cytochrome biogenesis protein CcmI n=1 Tax=unclassified Parasaccharibacter TaxID=2626400 RepID=UPI001316726D|nr:MULTISPECIES: c-type cytochrome biogenesis protein CcmI [unclassified Parasaccharibacter]MCK8636300.1 c-type cytochrome biogenesis protein CcmI [Parasaccharibacter sp. TMW2.1885]MCL1496659.1 c-type cytochrome biogenesis protein CcmI [Parasaccharibacter sp. TMW2.1882]MCL1510892.1 c-type cytochrome biogenesis protein CcmI [Parasaccharibacter sp. TMW 2.1884]QGT74720.1 c-type cytochrome biogenesis protein CcmI [Bombella sp. ESL0368]
MSLLIVALICLFIGLPIGLSLILRMKVSSQTDDPTLSLYRRRLDSLERDRKAGLLEKQPYDAARIETEREIVNHVSTPPQSLSGAGNAHKIIGLATLLLIPLLALLLYAINGQPFFGPQPASQIPASAFRTSPISPPASTMTPSSTSQSGQQP